MLKLLDHLCNMAVAHVFIFTSVLFFIVGGLFTFFVGRQASSHRRLLVALADHYFPWAHWRTPTVRVDVVFYVFTKLTQGYVAVLSTFLTVSLATAIRHGLAVFLSAPANPPSGTAVMVASGLVMYVFGDFGEFLSHVLQHRVPALWEFHKVHHSATFLTPLTAYRSHPVSNLLDAAFMGVLAAIPAGVAAFVFGFTFDDLLLISGTVNLVFTIGLLGVLQHSHFPISFGPLERVFVSPVMHQVHHSVKREHWNKNYGSRLSIWDWWLGTAVILPKQEQIEFGINPRENRRGAYASIVWCYVGPIIACCRMLLGRAPQSASSAATSAQAPTGSEPAA